MTPADLAARVGGLGWDSAATITAPNGATIDVPTGRVTPEAARDVGGRGSGQYPRPRAQVLVGEIGRDGGYSRWRTADELRLMARDLRLYAAELDELAGVADKITRPADAPAKAGRGRRKVPLARFAGIDIDEPTATVVEGS